MQTVKIYRAPSKVMFYECDGNVYYRVGQTRVDLDYANWIRRGRAGCWYSLKVGQAAAESWRLVLVLRPVNTRGRIMRRIKGAARAVLATIAGAVNRNETMASVTSVEFAEGLRRLALASRMGACDIDRPAATGRKPYP